MKNLFQAETITELNERLDKLSPASQRQWGKMNVSQMLAHCSAAVEVAVGDRNPPQLFLGKILGPLLKSILTNDKPFKKNSPTDKSFVITDDRDFDKEKARLKQLIKRFHEGGEEKCTTHPHSFFGKLSPGEWSRGMYKHLDHHLRQFGG